ncbi:phage tail protein [Vibrio diabolicus]|uniref:phage tail protein n=1 Tax=Vibrio diabolicus TaxID=50719 RepID=UPI00215CFF40|nr:phage tail protein [Vibrio diabolicus]MCR9310057.1 phage tail protein [Vibrio diabolicus]
MANSTDKSILTAAGKALLAQLNAEEKALVIDKMIFANVPNRPEYPQPDDVVPTDHIVHQEQVEQRGRLSADSVIYSTTLTSDVGPFDFNWTGAYCSEYGVLVTIDHHALTPKTADEPGVAGNTLVRSVVLEYKDIAEITNITVDASSWQYNATERMKKMDSDVAQSIIDQNGKDWFIEDGFLVTPSGSAYSIKAGAGYVSGNRVAMEFDRSVQVPNKPSFIYIDAHREGTPTGEQVTLFNFVVTAEEKDDYIDSSTGKDVKHFVCKIAQVLGDGSVSDLRPEGESAGKEWVKRGAPRRFSTMADALSATDFVENDIIELSAFDTRGYGKSTWIGTGVKDASKASTFDRRSGKFYGSDGSECRYQFRSLVDPEHWGAIPNDGNFDNQDIIEDACVYLPSTGALLLANLVFYARNIFWPNKTIRITSLIGGSTLRSIDEGEDSPFIEAFSCPLSWKNGSRWVSSPLIFKDITIDGGDKKRSHVVHYYFGRHTDFTVDGGTENTLCMTARSLNGPVSESTMVNNRFVNFEAFGSARVGFFVDEDGKTTDWELVGAYLWNTGEVNIDARTLGGALITDLHCFSSPVSMKIKKWSTGTRINNLYLEKDLVINEGMNNDTVLTLGPNVDVTGNVELNFGSVAGVIKSNSNTYRSKVKHNYYGLKKFISLGDIFDDSDPLVFHNNDANNSASFELSDSLVKGERRTGKVTTSDKTILSDGYVEYPIDARVPVSDSSDVLQFKIPVSNNANNTESYKVEVLLTGQYNNYQQFGRSVITFIVTTQVRYNQENVIVSIDEVNRDEHANYAVAITGAGTLADGITVTMTPTVNAAHSTGSMQATITHKLQGHKYASFLE